MKLCVTYELYVQARQQMADHIYFVVKLYQNLRAEVNNCLLA